MIAFSDVKNTDYFYTATLWASEKGILAGYKDGTFRPDELVTRAQAAVFITNIIAAINN